LDDVYQTLFRRHGLKAAREDGSRAVLNVLGGTGDMQDFAGRYVEGDDEIDLAAELTPFGLRLESTGARTRVVVSDSPDKSQRDLLKKFGYNEKGAPSPRRPRNK
jgi:predicted metalloprotease with PDZ domain